MEEREVVVGPILTDIVSNATKSIIVELIVCLLELITESIVALLPPGVDLYIFLCASGECADLCVEVVICTTSSSSWICWVEGGIESGVWVLGPVPCAAPIPGEGGIEAKEGH